MNRFSKKNKWQSEKSMDVFGVLVDTCTELCISCRIFLTNRSLSFYLYNWNFLDFLFFPLADGYSYSIMISAFCRGGLLEDAKQLAKDFEGTHDRYDLVMLNTMICAYCRAGDMDSVMEMMRKMDELKITPDYNTFHILIKYFCKEKLYLLAYQTMEDMHKKGHQPDEVFFQDASSWLYLLN